MAGEADRGAGDAATAGHHKRRSQSVVLHIPAPNAIKGAVTIHNIVEYQRWTSNNFLALRQGVLASETKIR